MTWEVETPPNIYPITLAELKNQLRIDVSNTDEDDFLNQVISSTSTAIENHINRPLMSQEINEYFNTFKSESMVLGFPNITFVSTIAYIQQDSTDPADYTDLSSAEYYQFLGGPFPYVNLNPNKSWPSLANYPNAVKITYTCGYLVNAVPSDIKMAALLIASQLYYNREDYVNAKTTASDLLLDKYKIWTITTTA